eukprot:snap_masked-scaffold_3-processed-gene-10.26-mRNA-1 protein AED:0.38 eAED:0.40 QI:0/0/0/0.5/1/1/2/0/365
MTQNQNNSLDLSTPQLIIGTLPYSGDKKVVSNNLKLGLRHIDTAELYRDSLPYVRQAIEKSKIPRSQLFISSKINGMNKTHNFPALYNQIQEHIEDLGCEYLDLLYIHWPGEPSAKNELDPSLFSQNAALGGMGFALERLKENCNFDHFQESIQKTWDNMRELKRSGLILNIGISNFYLQHIRTMLSVISADEIYACQIYLDATNHEPDLVAQLQELDIHVVAYRPLKFLPVIKTVHEMKLYDIDSVTDLNQFHSGERRERDTRRRQGRNRNEETTYSRLEEITKSSGCDSVEQMILASLLKRGISVCVKSSNMSHARSNSKALSKARYFPEDLLGRLPMRSEALNMFYGYDEYAEVFKLSQNFV